jgi:sulfate permease, SulP family
VINWLTVGRTAPIDSAQNARSVREDTAELASYLLSDRQSQGSPSFLLGRSRHSLDLADADSPEDQTWVSDTIQEVSEPSSPDGPVEHGEDDGPSALSNLLRKSPPQSVAPDNHAASQLEGDDSDEAEDNNGGVSRRTSVRRPRKSSEADRASENTPLLGRETTGGSHEVDLEGQKGQSRGKWSRGWAATTQAIEQHPAAQTFAIAVNPKRWDRKAIWQNGVVTPASCVPAVCVGLLLNILDALSYGKLF